MAMIIRTSPNRTLTLVEPIHYHPVDILDELEMLAGELWDTWTPVVSEGTFSPRMDMYEEKDELIMKVELPGIKKENIDIKLEGDCLSIKAEKKPEEVSKEATYYSCERCFGEFYRSLTLPFPVDSEKVSSTFENGVLEIRLPKAEQAKAKQIEVKVS